MSLYDIVTPTGNIRNKFAVARRQATSNRQTMRITSHPDLGVLTNAFITGTAAVPARVAVHGLSVLRASAQAGAAGHITGPVWATYWTLRREGVRAFYKGVSVAGAKSFPLAALQFGIYDAMATRLVPNTPYNKATVLSTAAVFTCGGVAAATAQALLHPLDVVKTRLMLQDLSSAASRVYSGPADCFQKMLVQGGLASLYRGFLASVAGASIFGAYMFASWDAYNRLPWNRLDNPLFFIEPYAEPVLAIAIGSLFSSPFDVIRRKMMAYDVQLPKNGRVNVVADTLTNAVINTYKEGGIPAFFHGYLSSAIKAGPQLLIFYLICSNFQKLLAPNKAKAQ